MSGEGKILGFPAKWAGRVLIASLVVNFLLIGVAVGVGMRAGEAKKNIGAGSVAYMLGEIVGEDRRAEVRRIMKQRHKEQKARRGVITEDWRRLAETLVDPAFDAAKLRAVLAEQTTVRNEGRELSMAHFADAIEVLNAEERRKFAGEVRELVERREAWANRKK